MRLIQRLLGVLRAATAAGAGKRREAGRQAGRGGRWLAAPLLLTVEDGHGLGGDACVGVHLLQNLEQVDFVAAGWEGCGSQCVRCVVCGARSGV